MIIGIDARFALGKRRGIGNYTLKLIQNLAKIDNSNEYIMYVDKDDVKGDLPRQKNFSLKKLFPSNYALWEQVVLPINAKRDAVDILHCPGNTAPLLLYKGIKLVVSIMDVMYLKDYSELPKSTSLYQRIGRLYRQFIVLRTIKHISVVITISEFSKVDIINHLPGLEGKIRVVYLAANEGYKRIDENVAIQRLGKKFGIHGPYLLTLGAIDPRKNTDLIIKTFIELKQENLIKGKLLIVGIANWRRTKFNNIVNESSFKNDIIFVDFVSEDDLLVLYNRATIFLYPSLYEGFGIPLLEAMACGVPVIASNSTSIPEITAEAALLITPKDSRELKLAIIKLLRNKSLRNRLMQSGYDRVKVFSWEKMAEETLAIYKDLSRRK